jgi:hypothetical protein
MCTSGDRFCFLGFATFVCYPICKEEKLEVIFALFYFVVSLSGGAFLGFGIFGKHSPVNSRMRFSFMRWGRELTCERVGPWISIRPTSPPLLFPWSAAPPSPICLAAPSPSPSSPRAAATTTQNPSPPPGAPPAPPRGPPAWLSVVWLRALNWNLDGGRRKEEGKNPR